ncbi:MAG: hypothetical protein K5657_01955 [Desulfovibrio sp.]|nr:hypothetical protein [Desulfovibrio sp.]
MIYYIILFIILSLILWRWKSKSTIIILFCISVFIIIVIFSIINDKVKEHTARQIPCIAINCSIANREIPSFIKNESNELLNNKKIIEKNVSKEEMIKNTIDAGLIGSNSLKYILNSDFITNKQNEYKEYYLNNILYSNSLLLNFHNKCVDSDICIILINTTDKTITNERIKLSARLRNHSSDILTASEKDIWEDRLILPGEKAFICKKLGSNNIKEHNKDDIIFEAILKNVKQEK